MLSILGVGFDAALAARSPVMNTKIRKPALAVVVRRNPAPRSHGRTRIFRRNLEGNDPVHRRRLQFDAEHLLPPLVVRGLAPHLPIHRPVRPALLIPSKRQHHVDPRKLRSHKSNHYRGAPRPLELARPKLDLRELRGVTDLALRARGALGKLRRRRARPDGLTEIIQPELPIDSRVHRESSIALASSGSMSRAPAFPANTANPPA